MIPETELAREDQSAPPLCERIEEVVEHRLGAPAAGLLLSPVPQLPVGVISAGPVQAALASARFRVYPGVGWERCARLGVLAAASGAAATGLPLQCLALSLSVPASTTEKNLTDFWRRVHREATKLGVDGGAVLGLEDGGIGRSGPVEADVPARRGVELGLAGGIGAARHHRLAHQGEVTTGPAGLGPGGLHPRERDLGQVAVRRERVDEQAVGH